MFKQLVEKDAICLVSISEEKFMGNLKRLLFMVQFVDKHLTIHISANEPRIDALNELNRPLLWVNIINFHVKNPRSRVTVYVLTLKFSGV